jgi:ribosomal peptide maturation radical SAM protein 1
MEMLDQSKKVLLVSMPFAGIDIPSIQLPTLQGYAKKKGVCIETRNLYLKAASIYGLHNYNALIYPPNDSYTAQLVFSKYVFADHWKKNYSAIKQYYTKNILEACSSVNLFDFESYVQKTDIFYQWVVNTIDWDSFDIVGFTLNYGQFLPSLAVAKEIKSRYPHITIVLGGSRTVGALGKHVLECFDYIDYIVSGDGELALTALALNTLQITQIPNVQYRYNDMVQVNPHNDCFDLNELPILNYDQFFSELELCSQSVKQYFQYYGRMPVEISRGCFWNNCSFCNLNIQYCSYREKKISKIITEIDYLSSQYKILDFHLIGNVLPQDHQSFLKEIQHIGKDFRFFAETRAGRMKSNEYLDLKNAGFREIQTGIESFSPHYLKTMNKGTKVIDNIAVLKYCKENGISNRYNLIIGYPNEEPIDFIETKENIKSFISFLDPPNLCQLRVLYKNKIYNDPSAFNIKKLRYSPIDTVMFPSEYLEKGICFVYDFIKEKKSKDNEWETLINEWKNKQEEKQKEFLKSKSLIDDLIFYFVDGGNFVKIYDKRDFENVLIYMLNCKERDVLLECSDVISYEHLQQKLSHITDYELAAILHSFEENNIVFREDNYYLSLPLNYRVVGGNKSFKQSIQSDVEENKLINNCF